MKCLHDVVATKRRKPNTIIEIPGHEECIAEVIAVGPGKTIQKGKTEYIVAMTVQAGDYVMFSPRAGQDKDIDGETITFIREKDILCVLDESSVKVTDNAKGESRECVGSFNFMQ